MLPFNIAFFVVDFSFASVHHNGSVGGSFDHRSIIGLDKPRSLKQVEACSSTVKCSVTDVSVTVPRR